MSLSDLASANPMPVEVPSNKGPAGINQLPIPTEAVHLDMLNPYWAVAIRRSVKDPRHLELATLVPSSLDRAAHTVEMNFPGSGDPFGYRKYQPLAR
jgi:hypothetical protein